MLERVIFKANDIRGRVTGPDPQWDEAGAFAVGAAFVELADLAGGSLVLGRDMRTTGEAMSSAFAAGAISRGAEVLDTGLASTDQLWFASGSLDLAGVQFTASHNPPQDNGVKFCWAGAKPVSQAFLQQLADRAIEIDADPEDACSEGSHPPGSAGRRPVETLDDYAHHLRSLVPWQHLRRLTVVVDAGNGMAGHTVGAVLTPLNLEVIGLYLDLDGTFPNHQPNPLEPENLVDAQRAVLEHGADLALVFDGDADRCFIIDERGEVVSPSAITALIASAELAREPGATIVVNSVTSATVAEVVAEQGGQIVVSPVGHSYVKALMAQHDAVFGGEHSAHYYFRDFWSADTGMLAALHVLCLLGRGAQPLSSLVTSFERYATSGEINSVVTDVDAALSAVATAFEGRADPVWTDGLQLAGEVDQLGAWRLSLRPSNTESLLRLNVEAKDPALMAAIRDDVLELVRTSSTTTEPKEVTP